MKSKLVMLPLLLSASFFLIHCVQMNRTADLARMPAADPLVQRYAFEQCTVDSRLYLEDSILRMPEPYYRSHEAEWEKKIPISCLQIAQRNYGGAFAFCSNENDKPTTSARRPCMTKNYVTLTYNAFHDVMDCFNLDPKNYFYQIMIESGFHINAINRTGYDAGMAQFTGNGIKKILENNLIQRVHDQLRQSSRASCSRIASIIDDFDIESYAVSNRCALISIPQNPYRSMFFYYLHSLSDQLTLENMLSNIKELEPIMSEKLKKHLKYLAYNRGLTGTKKILKGYIESRKLVKHQIIASDFDLDINLTNIKKILRMEPEKRVQLKKTQRIKNLSFAEYAVIHGATYVSDMTAASQNVKRHLGDQCGDL